MRRDIVHFLRLFLAFILMGGSIVTVPAKADRNIDIARPVSEQKEKFDQLEREIEEFRVLLKIPGMSVAVVSDQKIVWSKGFGFSDREKQIAASDTTVYPIGEITKTFTATILMQLVEQSKLSLSDPAAKYTNGIKDTSIRVRHLINQTSELPAGDFYGNWINRFAFLSKLAEKSSGKSFQELLVKNILDPAGMSDTVPGQEILRDAVQAEKLVGADHLVRYEAVMKRLTTTYGGNDPNLPQPKPYAPEPLNGGTGLVSTVTDLAKYDIALDNNLLLKKETLNAVFAPTISNKGKPLPYALGWYVQQYKRTKLVWHYGELDGTASSLILKVPEKNLTFILLANSQSASSPFPLARAGSVMPSVFACSFYRIFVSGDSQKQAVQMPNWNATNDVLISQLTQLEAQNPGYSYEYDVLSRALMYRWMGQSAKATALFNIYFQKYSKNNF